MKKNLLIALAIILSGSLFAQNFQAVKKAEVKLNKANIPVALKSTQTADTITTYLDRGTNFYVYTTGGGFLFGNNSYYTETAMQYDGIANASLTDIIFWVGAKIQNGGTSSFDANVYNDASGAPGTVIGTTSVPWSSMDTSAATGGFNTVNFSTPVDLGGATFYVGINVTGTDSIGMVCNDPSSNDGQGENRAFCNYNSSWSDINTLFGGFDADAMYIPIVDVTVGAEYMQSNDLKLYRAYPNPTNGISNIKYGLESTQNVKVKVFDITGKTIFSNESTQSAGSHIVPVDFSNYPAGTYFYTIATNNSKITSKITVIK